MKITVQGSFGILMQNFFNIKVFFFLIGMKCGDKQH